jgi:hypothetical protein
MALFSSCRTPEELAIALKQGKVLETSTAGLKGKLVEVREDGFLVLDSLGFPGKAYVKKSDLSTQPPFRHKPGTRVATPYGWGVVEELRYREEAEEGVDYVVALMQMRVYEPRMDEPAKDGQSSKKKDVTRAYLSSKDVKFRADDMRTAEECYKDAEALRMKGNEEFSRKDYEDAVVSYNRAVECLGTYRGELPLSAIPKMKRAFVETFIKALGNIAQAHLSTEPAKNEDAFNMAAEVSPLFLSITAVSALTLYLQRIFPT